MSTLDEYMKGAMLVAALMDGYNKPPVLKSDGTLSYPRARGVLPAELGAWFLKVVRRHACGSNGAAYLDYCQVWKQCQSIAPVTDWEKCQECPRPAVSITSLLKIAFPASESKANALFRAWLRGSAHISMNDFLMALGNLVKARLLDVRVMEDLAIFIAATDAFHMGLRHRREELVRNEVLWRQLTDDPVAICLTWPTVEDMDPEMAFMSGDQVANLANVDLIPFLPPKSREWLAATAPTLRYWLGRPTAQAIHVTPYSLPFDHDHHPSRAGAPLALRLVIKPLPEVARSPT